MEWLKQISIFVVENQKSSHCSKCMPSKRFENLIVELEVYWSLFSENWAIKMNGMQNLAYDGADEGDKNVSRILCVKFT